VLKIGIPLYEKVNLEKHFNQETFSSSSDGYLWETVNVTGKLGALEDDLRERLRGEGVQQAKKQDRPVKSMLNKAPKTQEEIEAAFDKLISK
jgi:transposase